MADGSQRVGFIGLGKMGQPMAENLARSPDWTVLVHDARSQPVEAMRRCAGWGRSLFAAGHLDDFAACSVVITMLPDSTITNAVVLGDETRPGLIGILKPGATILDMGSSDTAETVKLAERLSARTIGLVDTPVSGSVVKARSGELTIMVGASEADSQGVQAILRWMGKTIIHTGGVGSAHAMKTLNNYVYAAGLVALGEALVIARRMGLDDAVFADVLNVSSGKNFATETKLRQFILPRTFDGGFALRLLAKDLATAERLRERSGADATQLSLCAALAHEALEALPPGTDSTEIVRFLEERRTGAPGS